MKNPKISVILPVFNVESYLECSLNSIAFQTFQDFELIIINDCSPDNSEIIINQFIINNPNLRIKYIKHSENKGLSGARNSGMDAASGEFIYFIDSDDDISPNCFSSLIYSANQYNPDVVVANNYLISQNEKRAVLVSIEDSCLSGIDILHSYCQRKWYCQVWNKLYRTEFLTRNKIRFLEGAILEDELFSFHIATCACKISFVNAPLYNYYIRPKSIMSNIIKRNDRHRKFGFIIQHIHELIHKQHLLKDPFVGWFMLENLLVIINGYNACNTLTAEVLNRLTAFNQTSGITLWKHKFISFKQLIAYSYFFVPKTFSYPLYKILSTRTR